MRKIPSVHYCGLDLAQDESMILLTNTHTQEEHITPQTLQRTKLIIHPNSGHDNFSNEWLNNLPCPFILGNPIRSQAVTQYVMGVLFHHFQPIPWPTQWDQKRQWPRPLMEDLNILLLGQGSIGSILKKTLSSLNCPIDIVDPYQPGVADRPPVGKTYDVIILCCDNRQENFHFINQDYLQDKLTHSGVLINPARGDFYSEETLINLAQHHPERHFYIDVFSQEPKNFGDFKQFPNIHPTSHIAGVYQNLEDKLLAFEQKVIWDFTHSDRDDFLQKYQQFHLNKRVLI